MLIEIVADSVKSSLRDFTLQKILDLNASASLYEGVYSFYHVQATNGF